MKSLRHIFKRLRCMRSNRCEKLHGDRRIRYKCLSVQHAICRALLFIKPLKPDLHPIIAGAPSVHTAETIFHESPLLVKKSSKIFFTSMAFAVIMNCLSKRNSNFLSFERKVQMRYAGLN